MISVLWQSILFIWFTISLYLVAVDSTLNPQLKIFGEIINLLSLAFVAANMTIENQPVDWNNTAFAILYFIVNIILLAWYMYYTPIDFKANYPVSEKILYCSVDVAMLIYLFTTLLGALFIKVIPEKLSIINQMHTFKSIGFHWF